LSASKLLQNLQERRDRLKSQVADLTGYMVFKRPFPPSINLSLRWPMSIVINGGGSGVKIHILRR
jgi:hypothetical protein